MSPHRRGRMVTMPYSARRRGAVATSRFAAHCPSGDDVSPLQPRTATFRRATIPRSSSLNSQPTTRNASIANLFIHHSPFFILHPSFIIFHSSFPVRVPRPARSPLARANIPCANPAFFGGFRAPEKTLKKLRPTPLRPKGRFGILLTRCAAQGETPAGRGTDL